MIIPTFSGRPKEYSYTRYFFKRNESTYFHVDTDMTGKVSHITPKIGELVQFKEKQMTELLEYLDKTNEYEFRGLFFIQDIDDRKGYKSLKELDLKFPKKETQNK